MKFVFFIFTSLILTVLVFSLSEIRAVTKMKPPRIIIKKSLRRLQIYDGQTLIKTYKIALGFAPEEAKQIEGDGKTPEGKFYVFTKNADSKFYLSLGVSYPNIEDAKRGLKENLITQEENNAIVEAIRQKQTPPQKTKLGGEIYIHGGGTSSDWTRGCIALENKEIKEIFEVIPIGTTVEILS